MTLSMFAMQCRLSWFIVLENVHHLLSKDMTEVMTYIRTDSLLLDWFVVACEQPRNSLHTKSHVRIEEAHRRGFQVRWSGTCGFAVGCPVSWQRGFFLSVTNTQRHVCFEVRRKRVVLVLCKYDFHCLKATINCLVPILLRGVDVTCSHCKVIPTIRQAFSALLCRSCAWLP